MKLKKSSLFFLVMLLIPLAVYRIGLGGIMLSLDRIIFLVFITFFALSLKKNSLNRHIIVLSALLMVAAMFSFLHSSLYGITSQSISYLINYIYGLFLFLFSAYYIGNLKDLKKLDNLFTVHLFIVLFFSLYTYYYILIVNDIYFQYPLSQFLHLDEEGGSRLVAMSNSLRLFFPTTSAPRLGFITGFISIYFLIRVLISNENKLLKFHFLAFLLTMGTISRSAILSYITALGVLFAYLLVKNFRGIKFVYKYISVAFLFMVVIIIYFFEDLVILERLTHLDLSDRSAQGHLGIRLKVINELISSSINNVFFGYGVGNTVNYLNVSSAHSSYFTILFEQGIVGFSVFSMMLIYMFWLSLKNNYSSKGYFVLVIFLVLAHLFYEASAFQWLWCYMGVLFGLIINKTNGRF